MADWTLPLTPLALVALVALVRFVGCGDLLGPDDYKGGPPADLPPPPQVNQSRWPLNGTADDVEGGHSGIFVEETLAENPGGQSPTARRGPTIPTRPACSRRNSQAPSPSGSMAAGSTWISPRC
jgi:hypothetical protein